MWLVELQIHGNRGTQPLIPKTNLEVGLHKQVTCPNVTAQPQVTVAKVNSRTAKNGLPELGYFPILRKGKRYKKTSLVVRLGATSHGLH